LRQFVLSAMQLQTEYCSMDSCPGVDAYSSANRNRNVQCSQYLGAIVTQRPIKFSLVALENWRHKKLVMELPPNFGLSANIEWSGRAIALGACSSQRQRTFPRCRG